MSDSKIIMTPFKLMLSWLLLCKAAPSFKSNSILIAKSKLFTLFTVSIFCFLPSHFALAKSSFSGWVTNYDSAETFKPLLENMSHYETLWFVGANVKDIETKDKKWWVEDPVFKNVLAEAKARKIRSGPVLHNATEKGFDPELGVSFLKNTDAIVAKLLVEAKANGWKAINVDLESLPESAAENYEKFLTQLQKKFAELDVKISVCLHAKEDDKGTFEGAQFQRWEKLKNIKVDYVIMAYDHAWTTSVPGAVAPMDWVEKVVSYSVKTLKNRKVIIALPLFGYHWNKNPQSLSGWSGKPEIAPVLEERVKKDWVLAENKTEDGKIYRLREDEVIAFDDEKTLVEKIKKLEKKKVSSFAIWRLGAEKEIFYTHIENTNEKKK